MGNGVADISRDSFPLAVIAFFFFYCALEYIFSEFTGKKAAAVFSIIPSIILFVLLADTEAPVYVQVAVLTATIARLFVNFVPYRINVLTYGCFAMDIVTLFLYFIYGCFSEITLTNRFLFVCLAVMTLSALQKSFPFYYFVLLGILVLPIPMAKEPIDWSAFVSIGERIASAAQSFTYSFSINIGDNSYNAGYSSLNPAGGILKRSDKTQLILKYYDKPYHVYIDEETGKNVKVRKVTYLTGGMGSDKERFIEFINFLNANNVNKDEAIAFSEISRMGIEYAYIDTFDEIAPANSLVLTSGNDQIEAGRSKILHKKGYSLDSTYLDVDYASPYLISMMRGSDNLADNYMTYEEACNYAEDLYQIDLGRIVGPDEYERIISTNDHSEYLETQGATDRMKSLAEELTENASTEYDKCKIIEQYLRQYTYNTNAVGGFKPSSDMSSASGLSDIADRFLFDSGEGYCVHYTSAMVMLLRLSGIPARVSTGFRYVFPFEKSDSYDVNSSLAHTWPEAYLKNVGWVNFEPTGAYFGLDELSWHRIIKEENELAENVEANPVDAHTPIIPELPSAQPVPEAEVKAQSQIYVTLNVIALVALSVIAILLIIIIGNKLIRHILYIRGTDAQKLKMDVDQIKKEIIYSAEVPIPDRGLLSDYLVVAPDELKNDIQVVFDAYYRIIYGNFIGNEITEDELAVAKNVRGAFIQRRKRIKFIKR